MKLFVNENAEAASAAKRIVLDDMMLTVGLPTTAGSRMLERYDSLFEAQTATDLQGAGYAIAGKANVGEFAFDLLGETSYFGPCTDAAGNLATATALLVSERDAAGDPAYAGAVGLDVNGAPRRSAALAGQVCVKPTYGTVSRYGTIAIACSGETVCATAATAAGAAELLDVLAGHDGKDGTSLPQAECDLVRASAVGAGAAPAAKPVKRVAVAAGLAAQAAPDMQERVAALRTFLESQGVEVVETSAEDDAVLAAAGPAWNILMSAELCNNISRFDGVKYGYRTADFKTITDLYTNSRTEAFGLLAKAAVLFGSETLSEDNYDAVYDKALRIRRVVAERFDALFEGCDAVLMPACSACAFTPAQLQENIFLPFEENRFTAPASITGLPAVAFAGIQLVGPAFADLALLDVAAAFETYAKEA